jgi:hypothetical protein
MDLYWFKVDSFEIIGTRAPVADDLILVYAAYADGDVVASKLLRLTDGHGGFEAPALNLNPDDYVPDAQKGGLRVVINDPLAKVAFNFQLVNAGNVPASLLTARVASTADQMAGILAGVSAAGAHEPGEVFFGDDPIQGLEAVAWTGGFWMAIALEAFANVYSWINVDCDGPVAADQIAGPRYCLDAVTDNDSRTVQVQKDYPGIPSPTGCGATSSYNASWSFRHSREWVRVMDETQRTAAYPQGPPLNTAYGVGAASHNGAVYALTGDYDGNLQAARSFTGATWKFLPIGPISTVGVGSPLPVSAVSFNDRLYALGVYSDGSIRTLYYTSDGGSWTSFDNWLQGIRTEIGITTTVFRDRLYVVAKDSDTKYLRITSTDDLVTWDPWADIPQPIIDPTLPAEGVEASSVAAATLDDTLHIFAVYSVRVPGPPQARARIGETAAGRQVLLHNSTLQDGTWSGWHLVEKGTSLKNAETPLDVAAVAHQHRIYIASRWDRVRYPLPEGEESVRDVIGINFSEDGGNWSGWRIPVEDHPGIITDRASGTTAALAGLGNHLYIFGSGLRDTEVWVY